MHIIFSFSIRFLFALHESSTILTQVVNKKSKMFIGFLVYNPSFTFTYFCVLLFDGIVLIIRGKIKIHFYTLCLFAMYVFVFFSQSILIFWGQKMHS